MELCIECTSDGSCPFACTEASDQAQNYGCLPTPFDIIYMRIKHGKTWACHSNTDKPCLGGLLHLKENNLPYKVIDKDLLTEKSDWHRYCKREYSNTEVKIIKNKLYK